MPESYTDTPLLTERFDRAMAYALDHHRRQLRKSTTIPYASHLLAVTAIVLEMGGTEDEAIAALLHDVVEDGGGPAARERIAAEFGPAVAAMVDANTDTDEVPKPPWKERKTAYIESIAHKEPGALRVSLADKVHNASAIVRDRGTHGEAVWDRFKSGSGAEVRWYYRSLADAFEARSRDIGPEGAGALAELHRLVTAMDDPPPEGRSA
jgi:GTP pyrophosphokinase